MTTGYRRPVDAAALANNFRVFGEADCVAEPLYAALSIAIAGQPDTLDLLLEAPYAQRRPVLLFAAVHDLLLAGVAHPLAAFYRTVAGGETRADPDSAGDCFADFCRVERARLLDRVQHRSTQTNEVGRCAGLRLALTAIGRTDDPIALIDIGCSAGLNLLVDRYRCEYGVAAGAALVAGPESPVVLHCASRGAAATPPAAAPIPAIVRRLGIDLAPLDVRRPDDARWLQACVWPSDDDRHDRLAAAMALARDASLDLRQGDATAQLEAIVDTLDAGVRPVVFHSWVVSYFDGPARRSFVERVRALVVERDGAWISAEAPDVVPGLAPPPLPANASAEIREATVWHVTTRDGSDAVSRVVARSHPHCRWIDWMDTRSPD